MTSPRRRKEMAEEAAMEAYMLNLRQSQCPHFECDAVSFSFDGKVQQVRCRECGLTNEIDND